MAVIGTLAPSQWPPCPHGSNFGLALQKHQLLLLCSSGSPAHPHPLFHSTPGWGGSGAGDFFSSPMGNSITGLQTPVPSILSFQDLMETLDAVISFGFLLTMAMFTITSPLLEFCGCCLTSDWTLDAPELRPLYLPRAEFHIINSNKNGNLPYYI